jgi:undecaprenyl diphosphate synthase
MEVLSDGRQMDLTFALSYGSRAEIVSATRSLVREVLAGRLDPEAITEQEFARHLWTSDLGDASDVDLLIRTSGEMRISNFLLWQSSYAEFEFPTQQWPDYGREEFERSLKTFAGRKRRFGAI